MRRALPLLALACSPAAGTGSPSAAQSPTRPVVTISAPESTDAPPAPELPTAKREPLSGLYLREHEVTYVCEEPDWCRAKVTDTLRIDETPSEFGVRVELVQTNHHICTWQGRLNRSRQDLWEHHEENCELELQVTATEITITSVGCREYCGARAHFEATFDRASRQPLSSIE